MTMKKYLIAFSVDGKGRFEKVVEAPNPQSAKNIAKGEIGGEPGYAGKRINIVSYRELR